METLNDAQWELIEPLLPEPKRRKDNRVRPWACNRACSRGFSGFSEPGRHRGFCPKVSLSTDLLAAAEAVGRAGRVAGCVRALLGGSTAKACCNGTVAGRQLRSGKRGRCCGKTKRGKGAKWMVLVDGQGLPLGVRLESASPGEATLRKPRFKRSASPRRKGRPRQKPKRAIADRAYDSTRCANG